MQAKEKLLLTRDEHYGSGVNPTDLTRVILFFPFSFLIFFFLSSTPRSVQHSGHWLCHSSRTPFVSSLCARLVCIVMLWFCHMCSKAGRYRVTSDYYKEPENDNTLHYKWLQTDI